MSVVLPLLKTRSATGWARLRDRGDSVRNGIDDDIQHDQHHYFNDDIDQHDYYDNNDDINHNQHDDDCRSMQRTGNTNWMRRNSWMLLERG